MPSSPQWVFDRFRLDPDHACLWRDAEVRDYAEEVYRTHGLTMQSRIGLNSGEVVVRTIHHDLHMDYSAVGQTTHLAARMEQVASPDAIVLSTATVRLVEGLVRVKAWGSVPIKGLVEPVEVWELLGVSGRSRRLQSARARGLTHFVGRQTEMTILNAVPTVIAVSAPCTARSDEGSRPVPPCPPPSRCTRLWR